MGQAIVFVRPSTPKIAGQEFGHVGWGYEIAPGKFRIGSVENTKGTPQTPPHETDYWGIESFDPHREFGVGPRGRYCCYDMYKEIDVPNPNIDAAVVMEDWVSKQP